MSNTSNNKTIAKNTLYMYLRMLLTIGVSLYASRMLLQILGQDDFGTYNIVAGFVVMFNFVSTAMATATQRHLSYELGKTDGDIEHIFVACFKVHLWLSVLMFLLAETIGLWFINTQMNFPEKRMWVVNCLYQFSILSCMIGIVQIPFQATIVAKEKLSYYAYLGIFESIAKLMIIFLLPYFIWDNLMEYGILVGTVTLMTFVFCSYYGLHILPKINFRHHIDSKTYKEMLSFSGWTLFGSLANVGYQQGINVIINIFFGVGLNAAVGIANQVNTALTQFVSGFQQALNPQLVRSEAEKNRVRQQELIYLSSKLSFIIIVLVSFPVLLNLEYILSLWLGNYPDHTNSICRLILIGSIFEALSGPLWVTIFATGKIKIYQIVISMVLLMSIPFTYFGGKFGMTSEGIYTIRLVVVISAYFTRLFFLSRYVGVNIKHYICQVLGPVLVVCLTLGIIYILSDVYRLHATNMVQLTLHTILMLLLELVIIIGVCLSRTERIFIFNLLLSKLKNR